MFSSLTYLKNKSIKISTKNIIVILVAIISVCIILGLNGEALSKIVDIAKTLFVRLDSVRTGLYSEGSTFVHFRYYASLPYILSEISFFRTLVGFGFKNGGLPFVKYYNQYPDMVYGTESDPISLLYGVGLLGMLAFYNILFFIAIKGMQVDKRYVFLN